MNSPLNNTSCVRSSDSSSRRKRALRSSTMLAGFGWVIACAFATALPLSSVAHAQTLPTGGSVSTGSATIVTAPNTLTVNQSSQNVAINWTSFSIGAGDSVVFVQPNSTSIALNRVLGADPSAIFGTLTANGRVFLINPNGIVFAPGSQVNVSGLVASTLAMSDSDFLAGDYNFSGASSAAVLNQGTINADGGFVALLGANVSNEGLIQANLGQITLAAGQAMTLDVAGDGLINVVISEGAVNALAQNGGILRANGGEVLMTAFAAGELLQTVVNNTGVIEAQTIGTREGTIVLMADMETGTVNVGGVLDASAPDGGDGGLIATMAATTNIADGALINTTAPTGLRGQWLIASRNFTVEAGGNISGATLSANLVTNDVDIFAGAFLGPDLPTDGNIYINEAIEWTASGDPTTLNLQATTDVDINAAITATNGNLQVCCGRDVNVNDAITTTNGSVLLNAGRNVNVFHAITTTDGNIALCAGHDVHIDAAVTLTDGTTIPAQSLGLPIGLTLIAGADGTGPGIEGGTIVFAALAPQVTVTNAPVTLNYNPVSYAAPSDFSTEFELTEGAVLTQRMLLFPTGDRDFDGTTATTLTGFNTTETSGLPVGVTLIAGVDATATFDSAEAGEGIGITYSGYTLGGANANLYALAGSCCVATFRTVGAIAAVAVPPPPPPPPIPPVVPVTPSGDTPTVTGATDTPLVLTGTDLGLAIVETGVRMPVFAEAPQEEVFTRAPIRAPRQDRN